MESIHIKPEREEQMLNELALMAKKHVDNSEGQLELLPIDPETHPAQRAYRIEGDPQSAAVIESIANVAYPKFPELQKQLNLTENQSREITRIGELLEAGNNVIVATNHGDLIDIALAEAAIYCALDKLGYKPRTGIIISKMVSMLGYRLGEDIAPAAEVLKILCNDIFLSFPRTETVRKSGLARLLPDDINKHNKRMTELLSENFAKGGVLLAVAPSGTTDKEIRENRYRLGAISQGTSKILLQDRTLVLPMAMWLHGNSPIVALSDIPRTLHDEAATHQIMEKIATTLTTLVSEITFEYDSLRKVGETALDI